MVATWMEIIIQEHRKKQAFKSLQVSVKVSVVHPASHSHVHNNYDLHQAHQLRMTV